MLLNVKSVCSFAKAGSRLDSVIFKPFFLMEIWRYGCRLPMRVDLLRTAVENSNWARTATWMDLEVFKLFAESKGLYSWVYTQLWLVA